MNMKHLLVASVALAASPPAAFAQICLPPGAEPVPPIIESALEGQGKYANKVYFFAGEHYVSYDWRNSVARVDNGYPLPLNAWKLSATQPRVDAAFNGIGSRYGKFGYFFHDQQYNRYDWPSEQLDPPVPMGMPAWGLPGTYANGVDAALDGIGKYAGLGYFFKGSTYARYDWSRERFVDELPISAWKLPPTWTSIDAAVNGGAGYSGNAYFFRGKQYVRYNWSREAVDLGPLDIAGHWEGVAEMLAVGRAQTRARAWITAALRWLREDLVRANAAIPVPASIEGRALALHFHLSTIVERQQYLPKLIKIFEDVERTLTFGGAPFHYATAAEAAQHGYSKPPPAFAKFGNFMKFTSVYLAQHPRMQAAMALHEAVHYVDHSAPADVYEHSAGYATLSASAASGNPSSYAMFAQHVFCQTNMINK